MKTIRFLLVALAVIIGSASAQAGGLFKFGPRVGLTVNELHFNEDAFKEENRTGWTAGLMTEFRVPVIGIGADLSVMYVRRNSSFLLQCAADYKTLAKLTIIFSFYPNILTSR